MRSGSMLGAAGLAGLLGVSAIANAQGGFGPPELTLVPV